jgi:hypothetical protein
MFVISRKLKGSLKFKTSFELIMIMATTIILSYCPKKSLFPHGAFLYKILRK